MKTPWMRIVSVLLLACATAAATPRDAVAGVSVTYSIAASQSMHVMEVVPAGTNASKMPAGVLKVVVTLAPASACQLVLRLDAPGAPAGSGTFIFQVTPSRPGGAALVDMANLLTGGNLSVQNVTLGACSFTVELE